MDFEADGKAQQMLEEVSLSLSDLVSTLEGVEKSSKTVSSDDLQVTDEELQHQQCHEEQHSHQQHQRQQKRSHSKCSSHSPPENAVDDLDCQIVTPPPKMPTTTITIPDSDNEIPTDILSDERGRDVHCPLPPPPPPILINSSLNKGMTHISPSSSFIKPRDLTRSSSPLDQPDRPPNPVPCSPPMPHMLVSTSHAIKQSPLSSAPGEPHSLGIQHPPSTFITPNPSIEPKRLKISMKNKMADDVELSSSRQGCEINPPNIKVLIYIYCIYSTI